MQQFSRDLPNIVDKEDMKSIIEISASFKNAKDAKSKLEKITHSIFMTSEGKNLFNRYRDKLAKRYAPVQDALNEFHTMDEANKKTSYERCEKEGYKHHLEFHLEGSQDVNMTRFVDKNNPNSNEVSVYFP